MHDIRSMTLSELTKKLTDMGEKPYRAKQLYSWLHARRAASYDEMTDLPAALRGRLEEEHPLSLPEILHVQTSRLDGTRKYLFSLADGNMIESVRMPYHHGISVCISSQAGCRMGCRFCASAIGGLKRSLLPSEMLGQIYRIGLETGERVSNVVVMGTGEPLDNYDNLLRFIKLLTDPAGAGLSQRAVTVSTCGIVPGIRKLAEEKLQITLALSLHAPNDEIRRSLMPVAMKYSMDEVLEAMQAYFEATGRRITLEYSLISGVNDGPVHAQELSDRIKGKGFHVNLIPVNPVRERSFIRTRREAVDNFKKILEKNGINVTIRREMGADIDGACGQLRARHLS
ncbi:MAG: 23S rRNA (adenine(2503)-C(2))-methyltransferase RlmN [Blautia sp.]|nr:23S rRNA (adenine(2503)-C(2))-methyltransferase RlmN [Blautia sp.]